MFPPIHTQVCFMCHSGMHTLTHTISVCFQSFFLTRVLLAIMLIPFWFLMLKAILVSWPAGTRYHPVSLWAFVAGCCCAKLWHRAVTFSHTAWWVPFLVWPNDWWDTQCVSRRLHCHGGQIQRRAFPRKEGVVELMKLVEFVWSVLAFECEAKSLKNNFRMYYSG